MKKQLLMLTVLVLAVFAITSVFVSAADMSASPDAPTIDGEDIANYGTASGTDKWWNENKAAGYPKGQTITTGDGAVWLNSLTYQVTDAQKAEPTKTYVIRVGTVYGSAFTEIYSETATQTFTWNGGEYMTWAFDEPVLLAPGTEYGIDVGMITSTSGWQTGIPYLNMTGNNYSDGTRYTSGTAGGGIGDDTMGNMSGDFIFHVDLDAADSSMPGFASPQNGGTVGGGDVELSWTNLLANTGSDVWVDVWYGTDPDTDFNKVVDAGQNTASVTISDVADGRYYWRIDSYLNGSATGQPEEGALLTFYVDDSSKDQLILALTALKNHVLNSPALSDEDIAAQNTTIYVHRSLFGSSSDVIAAAFDLVQTYDTTPGFGPLWVNQGFPKRDAIVDDIHWTIYNVMQNIIDNTYTNENVVQFEGILDGYKFASSAKFPGPVDAPSEIVTHTATINASYPDTAGWERQGDSLPARKPTGTYLAPGTIVTVTVPQSLVDSDCKIRVGAHSWDLSNRPWIKRLDRSSIVYHIDSTQVKVASPLGGGIYIEVPYRVDAGIVDVDITGAVRSPYFSAKSFHTTTLQEWQDVERHHTAPWADFQTDKYMCQVPTAWIYNMDDPVTAMANWDAGIDTFNDLMGFPRERGKETIYLQVDVINRSSVFAPGYPAVNVSDSSPASDDGGNVNSYLTRGPQVAPDWCLHEQGHGYFFPKFGGESESNVNLPHVAIWNQTFGYDLDYAFAASRGFQNNPHRTLDNTGVAWMTSFGFSPREWEMQTAEKAYQLKGHAKFVDIAKMFGWGVLNDFWKSFVDDYENGISTSTSNDEKTLRLSKAVGYDVRPLLHFWGIHPSNNSALQASLDAEGLQPSRQIYDRLLEYMALIPPDNAAFQTFAYNWWGHEPNINGAWTETEHARQWDTQIRREKDAADQQRPNGEIYVEASAAEIKDVIDRLIEMYYPDGPPAYYVDAGPDMVAWNGEPVKLDASIVDIDGSGFTGKVWSYDPNAVVIDSNSIEDPTVIITKDPGEPISVTLELMVDDGVTIPVKDTVTIEVYDTPCLAAIGMGLLAENPADLNEDCTTNIEDLALMAAVWLSDSDIQDLTDMAATWLDDYALTEPAAK